MRINNNINAMNANRNLKINTNALGKSIEKLSSGLKINRAGDNSAGLSISERMRAQINGLNRANQNTQDGISLIQTAEGATNEVQALLQRGYELSVQAANDSNVDIDRENIQDEINEIVKEIDRISNNSEFNTMRLFKSRYEEEADQGISNFVINGEQQDTNYVVPLSSNSYSQQDLVLLNDAKYILEGAVSKVLDTFSAFSDAVSNIKVGVDYKYVDGAGGGAIGTFSYISVDDGKTAMNYKLVIDSGDFNSSNYNKDELSSILSHEAMHFVMTDALAVGMDGRLSSRYPNWFIEGIAQTTGGGMYGGYNSSLATYSDAQMKNYLSKYKRNPYGPGYVACMYLGAAVNQGKNGDIVTSFNEEDVKNGINKVLDELIHGKNIDEVIADNTIYSGENEFGSKFITDAISFSRNLGQTVKNAHGLGSIMYGVTSGNSNLYNTLINTPSSILTLDPSVGYIANYYTGELDVTTLQALVQRSESTSYSLQIGANPNNNIKISRFNISSKALNLENISVGSNEDASKSISLFGDAIGKVSKIRSYYGAVQNRLEHTLNNLQNTSENLQDAESRIRDVDMAKEYMNYSKYNILQQATMSMLAQANQRPQGVLSLLVGDR